MLKLFLLLLLFAPAAFPQTDLPEIGKLSDLKGKVKFYAVADDADDQKRITEELSKAGLQAAADPDDADFFVQYREISNHAPASDVILFRSIKGQMDVYFVRDKKKVIAWSETGPGGMRSQSAAPRLSKKFLSDLKKLK